MLRLFPLRVLYHSGALLALGVPPAITPFPVIGDRLKGRYVDGCSSRLYFVSCFVCDPCAVVFNGVVPCFDPFSQFGYCSVVMEFQLGALDYSTKEH